MKRKMIGILALVLMLGTSGISAVAAPDAALPEDDAPSVTVSVEDSEDVSSEEPSTDASNAQVQEEEASEEDAPSSNPETVTTQEQPTPEPQNEDAWQTVSVRLNKTNHVKYMNGSGDGMFYPDAALTRAEAAQLIHSLVTGATEADKTQHVTYSDVDSNSWYFQAVNNLSAYGVMSGNEGKFRPDNQITRAEFVTILSRFEGLSESSQSFTDVNENHWAYRQILSAAEKGWVNGYSGGDFQPNKTLTRAEAATIINRVLGRYPDYDTIGAGTGIRIFPDVSSSHWAYTQIMEASISHEYTTYGYSENWSNVTEEKTVMSSGYHVIDGILYYVDPDTGDFARDRSVENHWFDINGKYVTGNATLDELVRAETRKFVTAGMTQEQMLKAAFDHIIKTSNFSYQSKDKLSAGATGWTEARAIPMFQTRKGNCYSYAAITYHVAKNLGYNPIEVAGYVGYNRAPHGWIEIIENGTIYIVDTELTMAKRLKGQNIYLYKITYNNAPYVYAKS